MTRRRDASKPATRSAPAEVVRIFAQEATERGAIDAARVESDRILADGLLDLAGATAFSGLGRSALYALMEAGTLAYVSIPGVRRRLIPRRALMDLAAQGLKR